MADRPAGSPPAAGGRAAGRTAMVTGGTAGIGAAFARRLAAEGYQLILVARDKTRLVDVAGELHRQHGVRVDVLPSDLATEEGCAAVEDRLRAEPMDLLVNNAGTSAVPPFLKSTVAVEEAMLRLNVHAVLRLTKAVLPSMVQRGHGDIVNVSSVAGFGATMPGSTYPASKAWVTNFSESIARAVRRHGVRVVAVCPGYTRTEFHDRAGIDMSKTANWLWISADEVAREGLRDLRRGKVVSVPNWKYKTAAFGMRHLPRSFMQRAARDTRGRIGRPTD